MWISGDRHIDSPTIQGMTTTPKLTCESPADLLALPAVMLGFYPEESTVLIAIRDGYVQFCARFDWNWTDEAYEHSSLAVRSAMARVPGSRNFLMSYGADPDVHLHSLFALADLLDGAVDGMFYTDGQQFWDVTCQDPELHDGQRWSWDQSQLAASAVFQGIAVSQSRSSAVAAVTDPTAPHPLLGEARDELEDIPDQLALLEHLMEREEPLDDFGACQLAILLQCEDCAVATVMRLNTDNARDFRDRLGQARRTVCGDAAVGVLGVLGIACWLDGQGAMSTECLMQLEELAPDQPLAKLLRFIHMEALPPRWWRSPAFTEEQPWP